MKKQMIEFVKKAGGDAVYSGEWPSTLFVQHRHNGKEWMIEQLIKKFGRHTQIRFQ